MPGVASSGQPSAAQRKPDAGDAVCEVLLPSAPCMVYVTPPGRTPGGNPARRLRPGGAAGSTTVPSVSGDSPRTGRPVASLTTETPVTSRAPPATLCADTRGVTPQHQGGAEEHGDPQDGGGPRPATVRHLRRLLGHGAWPAPAQGPHRRPAVSIAGAASSPIGARVDPATGPGRAARCGGGDRLSRGWGRGQWTNTGASVAAGRPPGSAAASSSAATAAATAATV